jgi:tetratricopeptide (TPR) repeat protein
VEKMSKAEEAEADVCCANCGIAGVDDIKLDECPECHSARYCGNKCRVEHRDEHEEECKRRQKDELHEKKLFSQPDETHLGECPLCFLPLPLDTQKSVFHSCCSKMVCKGCNYANRKSGGGHRCPFCREALPDHEEFERRLMKRVNANDPAALKEMGGECYNEGDYDGAFDYLTKAAKLGYFEAQCLLGSMYMEGEGVEKDKEKALHHYEKAAIGGNPYARYNLGWYEQKSGKIERAAKHFIIAAKLGFELSMKSIWSMFKDGHITKEDLETTLRSHQGAIDAMKSPQRDIADLALQN